MGQTVNSYKDLIIWQRAHNLALQIYEASLRVKRSSSNFDIWSQCLRSAFSVPANIVEGYHSHKGKSFISYLEIARASAKETEYWTLVLYETQNVTEMEFEKLTSGYMEVDLMVNSMLKKLRG